MGLQFRRLLGIGFELTLRRGEIVVTAIAVAPGTASSRVPTGLSIVLPIARPFQPTGVFRGAESCILGPIDDDDS